MSFKRRLSLSIVALLLALVTTLSSLYLRYLLRIQLRFSLQQAEILAEQVRGNVQETLAEQMDGRGFVPETVSQDAYLPAFLERVMGSSPTIAEIAVTDQTGRMLAGSLGSTRPDWAPLPPLKGLADAGFVSQLRSVYAPRRDYQVSRALALEGRPVLIVHVAVSTAFLRRELEPQIRPLAASVVASLLGSLVLAVVFSRVVFRPLDRLGEAIDRMTRGEFAPPPAEFPSRRDEYGALASKLSLLGQQFRDAREGFSSLRGNIGQLMNRLEGGVLLFDADDRLIIASAAAEPFLGAGRWQMMGQQLEDVFAAGTEIGALVASAARLRQPVADRLVELDQVPGSPGRVLVSVEPIEDFATRRRLGVLVTLRDAETRRQIATQVEVSNRLAAISQLTGGVAHEIKNPLNAITLHLELLKSRLTKSGQEPPPQLEVIAREMARLDRVVKTFLDFTRPVDLKLAEVSLGGLIEEVAALAQPEAQQHQVRILVTAAGPEAMIQADRDLLKQAVLNLAVNGVQAMPQGGELELAVARAGPDVELSISDQGLGIPLENRDKIFRLYYTTRPQGTGIGLAMAFRVVQLHNGTIDFSSEVGRGTTFRVRFPVWES